MSEIAVLFHSFINVSIKTQLIGNLTNNIKLFLNVKCDFINVRVCVCVCIYMLHIYESSENICMHAYVYLIICFNQTAYF